MPSRQPPATHRRRDRRTAPAVLLAVLLVVATAVGVLGHRSLGGSSASAAPSPVEQTGATHRHLPRRDAGVAGAPEDPPGPLQHDRGSALGVRDGELPRGATVFDSRYPGVAHLDPALLRALRRAATDAKGSGIAFTVNSGWRSRSYQAQLFRQAVTQYGSTQEAERWVARPGRSVHESGDAVDLGPAVATAWLSEYGAAYGLCQVYADEPWHYELRAGAPDHGCPHEYADPTHDPRLQH